MDRIISLRSVACSIAGLIGLGLGCSASALAQDARAPAPRPIGVAADYTADLAGVAAGGVRRGVRYLDNINVTTDADLDRWVGWRRGKAHVALLSNVGGMPNDLAGSIQGINNVEVGRHHVKLYEAWLEQGIGDRGSLRAGLYDVNSEFYQTDAAGLLISPMFGVGSELAATGVNGPAIFPSTALAARLRVEAGAGYGAVAVINAHAGTLGDEDGIDFTGRDGALVIGEAGWTASGRVAIGAWAYTRTQPTIIPPEVSQGPGFHGSHGVYLIAEHGLAGAVEAPRHVTGFLRLGLSEGKTTPFRGGWQGGLLMNRPFAARPGSAISIGAGSGVLSQSYRSANPPDLPPLARAETILEATYSDTLVKGITQQPDVQYVIRPAADRTIPNALVLALRLTVGWASR